MGRTIGIDLGTTNTVIAAFNEGEPNPGPEVLAIPDDAANLLKSVVMCIETSKGIEWRVGQQAFDNRIRHSHSCITSTKRFIGLEFGDLQVNKDILKLNTDSQHPRVVAPPDGESGVRFYFFSSKDKGDKFLASQSPIDIAAMLLKQAKQYAENALGEAVTHAVITVPAYFNIAQIEATRRAGEAAGFIVQRILEEPLATALYYASPTQESDKLVMVYDFGGGTFDVTIAKLTRQNLSVQAIKGDNHLGGDDIDKRLAEFIAGEIRKQTKIDLLGTGQPEVEAQLFDQARRMKERLSSDGTAVLDNIVWSTHPSASKLDQAFPLGYSIERATFERIIDDLIDQTIRLVEEALDDAGIVLAAVDQVLLAGGSSWIPLVKTKLQQIFPDKSLPIKDPSHVIALGAAKFAQRLSTNESTAIPRIDVLSMTIKLLKLKTEAGQLVTIVPERARYSPTNSKVLDWFTYEFYLPGSNPHGIKLEFYEGDGQTSSDSSTHYYGIFIVTDLPAGLVRGEKVVLEAAISGDRTLSCRLRVRSAEYPFRIEPDKWKVDLRDAIYDGYGLIEDISDASTQEHIELLLKRAIRMEGMNSQQGRILTDEIKKEIMAARTAMAQSSGQDDFQRLLLARFLGEAFCTHGEQWLSYIPLIRDEQLLTVLYEEHGRVATLQPHLAEARRITQLGVPDRVGPLADEIFAIMAPSRIFGILSLAQIVSTNPPHQRQHDITILLLTEQEMKERSRSLVGDFVVIEHLTKDDCVARILTLLALMRKSISTHSALFFNQLQEVDQVLSHYWAL